jgi:ABC-type dipeptide/oligopeptide/nickel transport system, ATPase component
LESRSLVDVRNLWVSYKKPKWGGLRSTEVHVLKGISFRVDQGEVYGIVGASGSGKTTLLRSIIGLMKPTKGRVLIEGRDIYSDEEAYREVVSKIGYVSQDPYSSMDPRMKVGDIVGEPLRIRKVSQSVLSKYVEKVLELVHLSPSVVDKYPYQLSGGMLQRVAIARALILRPKLILLDEPTSFLDVVTQAEILGILKELREITGCTYIIVSHDLNVVTYLSTKIAVLLKGHIVEEGAVDQVLYKPLHPYTRLLIESSKYATSTEPEFSDVGCPLHKSCPWAKSVCRESIPPVTIANSTMIRCWYYT